MTAAGIDAVSAPFDVTDTQQVKSAIDDIETNRGPIDILVKNAGIIRRGATEDLDEADWNLVIQTNLTAPFVVSKYVGRRAAKTGVKAAETETNRKAMEIAAGQLTIDYVLDERARELLGEGNRWIDLVRTGKLLERVRKYNPVAAANIKDFHVLRPIPQQQIDRTESEFKQNPGY